MIFLVYLVGVIAHTGSSWISSSNLRCTGVDSCKRMDTYDELNFVDVDAITCAGEGSCRGFNVDSTGPMVCSGKKSCEHMDSIVANDFGVVCSGQYSCSNQHGWVWTGTLANLTDVRETYNKKMYELAVEIDGQVYPVTHNTWANYEYLMTAEITHGIEPRAFKKVRYIFVKGLNWVQASRTVINNGATSTTWYRLLYRVNGMDTALSGSGGRASLAIESNDGAQTNADVSVYVNLLDKRWQAAHRSIQDYTERRTVYSHELFEMGVQLDGHISLITESIWSSNTRFSTEPYVCNVNGVLKLCVAVFEKGLTDAGQAGQDSSKWYKYHHEIGGGSSSLAFLSYVNTIPKHRLYYRLR